MVTLKKISEALAIIAIATFAGIIVAGGKVAILYTWFTPVAIQVSLGSIFFALVIMYIRTKREDLSPNKIKALNFKTTASVVILFLFFLWNVVAKPTVPVNVQFEGMAKTSDVMVVQKNVFEVGKTASNTMDLQSQTIKEQRAFKEEASANFLGLRNQATDYANDNQARDQAIIARVGSVDTAILSFQRQQQLVNEAQTKEMAEHNKKLSDSLSKINTAIENLSVTVAETKKAAEKRNQSVAANSGISIGSNLQECLLAALVVLALFSFGASFFFKDFKWVSVPTRRYYIPGAMVVFIFLLFVYPYLDSESVTSPPKKEKKDAVVKSKKEQKEKSEAKKEPSESWVSKIEKKADTAVNTIAEIVSETPPSGGEKATVVTLERKVKKQKKKRTFVYRSPNNERLLKALRAKS